jgi:folylpolyglutamate synthase/dihydropteroate synthase
VVLIFAVAMDKDTNTMLKQLLKVSKAVFFTEPKARVLKKFFSPKILTIMAKNILKKYQQRKVDIFCGSTPQKAFILAKKYASNDDIILVTGSFYLAGEIRKIFYPENFVLKNRRSF